MRPRAFGILAVVLGLALALALTAPAQSFDLAAGGGGAAGSGIGGAWAGINATTMVAPVFGFNAEFFGRAAAVNGPNYRPLLLSANAVLRAPVAWKPELDLGLGAMRAAPPGCANCVPLVPASYEAAQWHVGGHFGLGLTRSVAPHTFVRLFYDQFLTGFYNGSPSLHPALFTVMLGFHFGVF